MSNKVIETEIDYKHKEKIGLLLLTVPILVNIISIFTVICGMASENRNSTYLLLFISLILPFIGFIFSFATQKIYFGKIKVWWIVCLIINISFYVIYFLFVSFVGLVYRIFLGTVN